MVAASSLLIVSAWRAGPPPQHLHTTGTRLGTCQPAPSETLTLVLAASLDRKLWFNAVPRGPISVRNGYFLKNRD